MYSKLCKRVASKVTEQLKIWEIRKLKENLKTWWRHKLVSSVPCKIIFCNSDRYLRKSRYQGTNSL